MKKQTLLILSYIITATLALGQHAHDGETCDCPSCLAKANGFTLPALQGLNPVAETDDCAHEDDHAGHDHGADEHEGHDHDHSAEAHDDHDAHEHDVDGCDEHAGHDHSADAHDEHAGHDHGAEGHEDVGELTISDDIARKIGLKTDTATGGKISRSAIFPAEIKLNRDRAASVSPRYASIIREVAAEIGDEVKKGDVLATLENRETMATFTITAPIDGVIIAKNIAMGESASEEKVLFEVADLSSVWADISLFPKYQHAIRKGAVVEFVAHDGHTAHGAVQYISPLVSRETRTFTARCVLLNEAEDFTPGAFVQARIIVSEDNVAVRVPRGAVQKVAGENVVFIADEHGYESREVQTGITDAHFIEIKKGLKSGETYVTKGAFSLKAQTLTSGMDPHAGHGH